MNRVALLGGAGSIGKTIGLSLDSRNYSITSFDFKSSDKFENFIIDKNNLEEFKKELLKYSFCIIAIQKQIGEKNIAEFDLINTKIPQLVSELNHFKKIIYITTALIDISIDKDMFSNSIFLGEKKFVENQLEDKYTIIRPGNLINSKIPNYFTNLIKKLKNSQSVIVIGNGSLKIQFTTIYDLARYVNFCIENESPNQVHLYSCEEIEIKKLVLSLREICKSNSLILYIPKFLPVILLKLLSLLNKNYYPPIRIRALVNENISKDNIKDGIFIKNPLDLFVKEYDLND